MRKLTESTWEYKDARGIVQRGVFIKSSEGQGSDVTYYFKNLKTGATDVVSGSRLKSAKPIRESKLRNLIREILKELEDELDESNMTGNVDGYNTPHAFKKTDGTDVDAETDDDFVKRLNKSTGYTKVNETKRGNRHLSESKKIEIKDEEDFSWWSDRYKEQVGVRPRMTYKNLEKWANQTFVLKGREYVLRNESITENRYHQLRKSEGTPNQKIGVGIRELRKQLSEIEKFVSWYGNIKTENEMGYSDYWKRTQKHLTKISERLSKLSLKVRELSS